MYSAEAFGFPGEHYNNDRQCKVIPVNSELGAVIADSFPNFIVLEGAYNAQRDQRNVVNAVSIGFRDVVTRKCVIQNWIDTYGGNNG